MNEKIGMLILGFFLAMFVVAVVLPALDYDAEGKKVFEFTDAKTGGFGPGDVEDSSSLKDENQTITDVQDPDIELLTGGFSD